MAHMPVHPAATHAMELHMSNTATTHVPTGSSATAVTKRISNMDVCTTSNRITEGAIRVSGGREQ